MFSMEEAAGIQSFFFFLPENYLFSLGTFSHLTCLVDIILQKDYRVIVVEARDLSLYRLQLSLYWNRGYAE